MPSYGSEERVALLSARRACACPPRLPKTRSPSGRPGVLLGTLIGLPGERRGAGLKRSSQRAKTAAVA